jgi:hypothetical protein
MKKDEVIALKIDVAREVFSDLQKRLKNTRWSYQVEARIGTRLDYLSRNSLVIGRTLTTGENTKRR